MILVLLAFSLFLLRLKFRQFFTPISLLCIWWLGWLEISNLELAGIYPPSTEVSIMVMAMVASMVVGALMATCPNTTRMIRQSNVFSKNSTKPLFFLGAAVLIYFSGIAIILGASLSGFSGGGDARTLALEKSLYAYGRLGGYNVLIHEYLMRGIYLVVTIYGSICIVTEKYRMVLLAVLTSIAVSFSTYGRVPLYVLSLLGIAAVLWSPRKLQHRLSNYKIVSIIIGLFVLAGIMGTWLTKQRQGGGVSSLQLIQAFTKYHGLGFTILSQELEDPGSMANTTCTYGRSTLGGLDEVFIRILVNRVDKSAQPCNVENFEYRDALRNVGDNNFSNAFYTVLHSLYLDGRWPAIIVGPLFFGWVLGRWYLAVIRTWQEYPFMWVQCLSYIGFFSIFQSPCEEAPTFMAMVFLFLLSLYNIRPSGTPAKAHSFLSQSKPSIRGSEAIKSAMVTGRQYMSREKPFYSRLGSHAHRIIKK